MAFLVNSATDYTVPTNLSASPGTITTRKHGECDYLLRGKGSRLIHWGRRWEGRRDIRTTKGDEQMVGVRLTLSLSFICPYNPLTTSSSTVCGSKWVQMKHATDQLNHKRG